jgi:lipid-A-disaccharide synthase
MINILSGKFVVKEFIQKDAKPEAIAGEIEKIVMDKLYYQTMQNNFQQIKEYLGSGGAALRAAEMIDEHLRRRH